MAEADPLELENRRRLYEAVRQAPGLHLRELQRQLDWPMGQLEYHLARLVKAELLSVEKDRQFKRYFTTKLSKRDKLALSALRQAGPRDLAIWLMQEGSATPSTISQELEISPSTLSAHLKTLVRSNIAEVSQEGRVRTYAITDPELVLRNLIAYRPSYVDKLVDRFLETWLEAHR